MKIRQIPYALTLLFVVSGGLFWLFYPAPVSAQSEPETEIARQYVGSAECAACHRDLVDFHTSTPHSQALQNIAEDPTQLLADFSQGEDIRTILLPGEETPRPLTADDIRYAIGSGIYVQRYLYEIGENDFVVLPVEWDTQAQVWQPFVLSETWPDTAYDWETQCAYCHTTNFNAAEGLWAEDGVQCEACHGPGSAHLDAGEATEPILTTRERTALEASIELGLDPAICGQCHSQGTEPVHGYPFPQDYLPGDELLNQDVFRLVGERSAVHWWETGQAKSPNMQFNEWLTTSHAESFLTVEQHPHFSTGCLTCHNGTFSRAANIVAQIEANDDREQIDILYDEADLDIGNVYQIDWETLKSLTMAELELQEASINADQPFLPQILPQLIDRMHAQNNLIDGQILPRSMADVVRIGNEGTNDDHTNRALGVMCATCHDPHSTAGNPASLAIEADTLCTGCHRSAEPVYGLHHPVQQVFEGQTLIAGVTGMPSTHYTAENGPTCATCHMPQVPVENSTRISHTLAPILPADAAEIDAIEDSCVGCHGAQIEGQTMQELIDSIQNDTRVRYEAVRTAMDETSPAWIAQTLQIVEGDGSWGIHNYGYTTALLSHAERELGLKERVATVQLPDVPLHPTPQVQTTAAQITSRGLTPPSMVLLAVAVGIILLAGFLFLVRGRNQ
ncbi:MAG: hypothetical protein CL610_07325 [Anaerolineaceae bacterium]|nr:hypothetical protein [Anaerolineaceae bacterium]